jgi:hypothetical protein
MRLVDDTFIYFNEIGRSHLYNLYIRVYTCIRVCTSLGACVRVYAVQDHFHEEDIQRLIEYTLKTYFIYPLNLSYVQDHFYEEGIQRLIKARPQNKVRCEYVNFVF